MANRAGGPKSEREHGCSQPQEWGAQGCSTDKESVFGHFPMSGNSNGELPARITVLVVRSKGKSHVITNP